MAQKKVVYVGLEYLYGPLQKSKEDAYGNDITGVDAVDNDEYTQNY